jgi:hypothetical protein
MSATCYRCIAFNRDPVGEPFGVCTKCLSLACRKCGNRLKEGAEFRCRLCYSRTVLLPAAGLEGSLRPPGGGGGSIEPSGGGPDREVGFVNTRDWETLERELADDSAAEREFFHGGALEVTIEETRRYAADEVRREKMNKEANWEVYDDETENRRRTDAFKGAQLLARDISAAEASGTFRPDLLADALGVACWAIEVRPQHGEVAAYDRLYMLGDLRLRFAIGMAMPVVAEA